ncbi:ComEA family DNA-binding protein [Croceimicrobium hydrocarbonivorans]|uniref:Helix-hairpin-helix domain-containing protein n=1 Tax=Croceimicrobium hydrocarbonivorans TaxID=2761580 RepID=A0A7H0VGJ1_9FLAO|nr:helix-hairpin-helix domain-containing protein [Croceimicrobium hydrocarbonivorans]QNR24839.1 helix-hairpin-helix domain-containing protein [Croceimicrobium hydrocarbonivorans]
MYPSTERALIFLLVILLILSVLDWNYYTWFPPESHYSESEVEAIKLSWRQEEEAAALRFEKALSNFDPNQPDSMQLADLGLKPSQIQVWKNYLEKGGRFRRPEDLHRLYALDSSWIAQVIEHVKVRPEAGSGKNEESTYTLKLHFFNPNEVSQDELLAMGLPSSASRGIISFREKYRPFQSRNDIYKVYTIDSALARNLHAYIIGLEKEGQDSIPMRLEPVAVEINLADSLQLLVLPGIGPFRAQRILEWRQRLGGFHSIAQLLDHHLIDSLSLDQLELYLLFNVAPKQLSLNYDSMESLQGHPYINYYLARSIIDFREQVRAFKSVDELKNIELVDAVLFSKLAPYLKVSQKGTNAANLSN